MTTTETTAGRASLAERGRMMAGLQEVADQILHEGYDHDLTSAVIVVQVTESGEFMLRGLGHIDPLRMIGILSVAVDRLTRSVG